MDFTNISALDEDERLVLQDAIAYLMPPKPAFGDESAEGEEAGRSPPRRVTNGVELLLAAAKEDRLHPVRLRCRALIYIANNSQLVDLNSLHGPQGVFVRSMAGKTRVAEKVTAELQKREEKRKEECTFQPVINERSKGMSQSKKEEGFYAAGLAWKKAQRKKLEKKVQQERKDKDEEDAELERKWKLSKRNDLLAQRKRDKMASLRQALEEEHRALRREQGFDSEDSDEDPLPEEEHLWSPRRYDQSLQFRFAPTLNATSAAIVEGRVAQGRIQSSVSERLAADMEKRKVSLAAKQHRQWSQFSKSPLKERSMHPTEVENVVRRLTSPSPGSIRRQHKFDVSAEFPCFRPSINSNPNHVPCEIERVLRERREDRAQRKAEEWPDYTVRPDQPPMSPKKLHSFITRQQLSVMEKEAKCTTARQKQMQKEVEECTFTPKVTKYHLPSYVWEGYEEGQGDTVSPSTRRKRAFTPPARAETPKRKKAPPQPQPSPVSELLYCDRYSFVHDSDLKEDFREWFDQIDSSRVGWITPGEAVDASKSLAASLGCSMQYVDVANDFPNKIHFADFVLLLSRCVRLPSSRS